MAAISGGRLNRPVAPVLVQTAGLHNQRPGSRLAPLHRRDENRDEPASLMALRIRQSNRHPLSKRSAPIVSSFHGNACAASSQPRNR